MTVPFHTILPSEAFGRKVFRQSDLNSFLSDCIMEGRKITAAVIVNKSGMLAVRGKYFIDATGNEELIKADAQMRESVFLLVELMKKNVPEFRNCVITSIASTVGIRESRRVEGLHILTGEEYVHAHPFRDSVARACHPVDIHLPNNDGQKLTFPDDAGFIPLRCLITKEFPNLLTAGRIISADADAFAAIRVQVSCMETGQAAGAAAAICVKSGDIPVQQVDSESVVQTVRAFGSCV